MVDQGHKRAVDDDWGCSIRLGEVADPGLQVGHTPEQQAGGIAGGTLRVVEGEGARDGVAPPDEVCCEGAGLLEDAHRRCAGEGESNRVGTTLELSVTQPDQVRPARSADASMRERRSIPVRCIARTRLLRLRFIIRYGPRLGVLHMFCHVDPLTRRCFLGRQPFAKSPCDISEKH